MQFNLKNFVTTKTGDVMPTNLEAEIVSFVSDTRMAYESARSGLEDFWRASWAAYIGTPQALDDTRREVLKMTGQESDWWRHRISTGKAFESVEAIVSYLQQATFPTANWFALEPTTHGQREYARLVEAYMRDLLVDIQFKSRYKTYLRQLVILGTSTLALPWRQETLPTKHKVPTKFPKLNMDGHIVGERVVWKTETTHKLIKDAPELEVVDAFDIYLDPNATDPNEATMIRRIHKRRSDLVRGARNGLYNISTYDAMRLPADTHDETNRTQIASWEGVQLDVPVSMSDLINVYELWGDVHLNGITFHDVVALTVGHQLLSFQTNPFWCGRPFITGTYINLARQPYSIGAVQPSLGLLQEMNIITNARLDNIVIESHGAHKYVDDGVINPEEIVFEPGALIPVGDINNLQPIQMPTAFAVTYTESDIIEKRINSIFGTPGIISNGQGRSGERVTATEIQATKDAGGNRLTGVFEDIENTSLKPILTKIFKLAQQFVEGTKMVKVTGIEQGSEEYYEIDGEVLQHDYTIKPMGAEYVISRDKAITDRVRFMEIVSTNPEMAQIVDFQAMTLDILQAFGFDDPMRYIKPEAQAKEQQQEESAEGEQPMPSSHQQIGQEVNQLGGSNLSASVQSDVMNNGNMNAFLDDMMGGSPEIEQQPVQDEMFQ